MAMILAFFPIIGVAVAFMVAARRASGIHKVPYSMGALLFIAFPLVLIVGNLIQHGKIYMYDQPWELVLFFLIVFMVVFCGTMLQIIIGIWQLKNKKLSA